MPRPPRAASPGGGSASFPTTHWSLIVAAGEHDNPVVRVALEELCRQYWYPLYVFVRRRGYDAHQAEDVTQEFFAHLLAPDYVRQADPGRGRFRTFLLASLRNFLSHAREHREAQKRGGGVVPVSLDAASAAERFRLEPVEMGLTPEQTFERTWALNIIEQVLAELETEYAAAGRGPLFARMRHIVWGDAEASHEAIALELGINLSALKVSIHRLRKRVRGRLREAVLQTVARSEDTEDELHILLAALRPVGAKLV